jgi:AraC family transcriptional regulator of arabinose operon
MGLFHMKKHYARWREQGAPGWLMVYTLGGQGRFGHDRGELQARKGDLVLLRPRVRNDYGLEENLKRWDLLWAYFFPRADWLALLKWPEEAPGLLCLHLSNPPMRTRIVRQLMEAHRLHRGASRQREMLAMNALEKVLLLCDGANPRSEEAGLDSRVLRAMDYLCQNLSQPVTLDRLARRCGLSISRLAHLFREQVGQTPHQFLEMQRMTRARQLLDLTQQPVTAIAAEAGFPDLFHFSKRFKHHLGLSPRHYRHNLLALQSPNKRPWQRFDRKGAAIKAKR